jgi:hypothetical protein
MKVGAAAARRRNFFPGGFTRCCEMRRLIFGGASRRRLWKLRLRIPQMPVDTDRIKRVLFPFALNKGWSLKTE